MSNQDITKINAQVAENHNENIPVKVDSAEVKAVDERVIRDQEEFCKTALRIGKEFLSAIKDDRTTTRKELKEARDAEKRVQNQNVEAIQIYKEELKNPKLTEEQRMYILKMINEKTTSSQKIHEVTERTVREDKDHLHGLSKAIAKIFLAAGLTAAAFGIIKFVKQHRG